MGGLDKAWADEMLGEGMPSGQRLTRPEADALRRLAANGRRPLETGPYTRRWYPDAGTNRIYFSRDGGETHRLLPLDVYESLEFPQPPGWPPEERYPWFPSMGAAFCAAMRAVVAVHAAD